MVRFQWAYLNETDSNYKVYVAAILAARQAGSQLQIYTTTDTNGFCHIGHMALLPG